MSQELFNKF